MKTVDEIAELVANEGILNPEVRSGRRSSKDILIEVLTANILIPKQIAEGLVASRIIHTLWLPQHRYAVEPKAHASVLAAAIGRIEVEDA